MAGVLMKRGTHSPPKPSEGASPVHTLILGLWTPELGKNPFLLLKPPGEPVSEFGLHPGALPAGRQACPLRVPGTGTVPKKQIAMKGQAGWAQLMSWVPDLLRPSQCRMLCPTGRPWILISVPEKVITVPRLLRARVLSLMSATREGGLQRLNHHYDTLVSPRIPMSKAYPSK